MSQKSEALQNKMAELLVRAPAKAEFHLRPFGSQFFIKNHDCFHPSEHKLELDSKMIHQDIVMI